VRLGLKKNETQTSARQIRAHPLGWKDIKEFYRQRGQGLRADRERAMLCVAYGNLGQARRARGPGGPDVDFHPYGTASVDPRGKTDAERQEGGVSLARAVRWLKVWLEQRISQKGGYFDG